MKKENIGRIFVTDKYIQRFKTVLLYYFDVVAKQDATAKKIQNLFKDFGNYKNSFTFDMYTVYIYLTKNDCINEYVLKRRPIQGTMTIKLDTRKGKIYKNNRTCIDFNLTLTTPDKGTINYKQEIQRLFSEIITEMISEAKDKRELYPEEVM